MNLYSQELIQFLTATTLHLKKNVTKTPFSEPDLSFFLPPPNATYSWERQDIEQRLFFRGGRFTKVNGFLAMLIGLILSTGMYGVLYSMPQMRLSSMCLERGPTPFAIIFLFWWSLAILFLK